MTGAIDAIHPAGGSAGSSVVLCSSSTRRPRVSLPLSSKATADVLRVRHQT